MTDIWRQQDGTGIFGLESVGVLAGDIPAGSLLEEAAQQYPGRLVRMFVLFQTGFVYFDEYGVYENPPGPVIVLWALYVDGDLIENRQTLIGAAASDYPSTLPIDADSRFVPRSGIQTDVSVGGRQRGRDLFARDYHDITLYHHYVSAVDRALLRTHYLGNASREFDLHLLTGESYRVQYVRAPGETPFAGSRWTLVTRLDGYLIEDASIPTDGDYPSLAYDKSSTFEARGGILTDYATSGLMGARRGYADVIWDMTLVYPGISTVDHDALLNHYARYRRELFVFTSHAGDEYLVQYLERPFSIRHQVDLWTVTVRLSGGLA